MANGYKGAVCCPHNYCCKQFNVASDCSSAALHIPKLNDVPSPADGVSCCVSYRHAMPPTTCRRCAVRRRRRGRRECTLCTKSRLIDRGRWKKTNLATKGSSVLLLVCLVLYATARYSNVPLNVQKAEILDYETTSGTSLLY